MAGLSDCSLNGTVGAALVVDDSTDTLDDRSHHAFLEVIATTNSLGVNDLSLLCSGNDLVVNAVHNPGADNLSWNNLCAGDHTVNNLGADNNLVAELS